MRMETRKQQTRAKEEVPAWSFAGFSAPSANLLMSGSTIGGA